MNRTVLIFGIVAGIATVGYYLLFYMMQPDWMLGGGVYFSSLLIYGVGMYAAIKDKVEVDFKSLLRSAFIVFLIANVVFYIFDFVLFKIIDPGMAERQANLAIAMLEPHTPIEQQVEMRKNIENTDLHSFGYIAYRYAKGTLGGFGIAAFVAYLVKRG
jgi:hypothetical protein